MIGNKSMDWVDPSSLVEGDWRCTYILKPDVEVLYRSLEDYGWLQPLVVQKRTRAIIDGHYRWEVSSNIKKLNKDTKGLVPVLFVDCDDIDAMLMHLRLNRGRGDVLTKKMSRIVQFVLASKKYDEKDIKFLFNMHADELDVMVDGTLLKHKKIADHKYSAAWVPIEAPATVKDQALIIERPPNKDG